ncbi:MAG: hypothetical protein WAM89_17835 [Terriglobales bacterium]
MSMRRVFFYALRLGCLILVVSGWMHARGQGKSQEQDSAKPGAEYSGMYSFLSDGEFIQLTVEDQGRVIGFISRYADSAHENGFLNQLFDSGRLDGKRLAFTTKIEQGVSFEFQGTVERGAGKNRADEGYYVLNGTLIEKTTDAGKKTSAHSQEVVLKSFPQNLAPAPEEKK